MKKLEPFRSAMIRLKGRLLRARRACISGQDIYFPHPQGYDVRAERHLAALDEFFRRERARRMTAGK